MAYTIISQNNSTTTLSDGVNTITVPSRVNLTSGNFTIVEVNNNMATLEDGDGNVYRDIPCVATLAGEGGGGGSGLPDQTGHSGEFLTTDGTDASWASVDALPDQTGNSGKFLTTDGTDASWATINALQNKATGTDSLTILGTPSTAVRATNIGVGSTVTGPNATALGQGASASGNSAVAVGINTSAANSNSLALVSGTVSGNYSKGIGTSISGKNSIGITTLVNHFGTMSAQYTVAIGTFDYIDNLDDHSFYVGLGTSNADYKLLSADGTIPTARLTKVNSTVTIAVADWNGGTTVTKTVAGITATGVVLVSPDPTDQAAYTSAGIICTAQAADSLTFTCSTTPSADIDVNVVCL